MPTSSTELNPGSFNQFAEKSPLTGNELLSAWAIATLAYRNALANEMGITLEELHEKAA